MIHHLWAAHVRKASPSSKNVILSLAWQLAIFHLFLKTRETWRLFIWMYVYSIGECSSLRCAYCLLTYEWLPLRKIVTPNRKNKNSCSSFDVDFSRRDTFQLVIDFAWHVRRPVKTQQARSQKWVNVLLSTNINHAVCLISSQSRNIPIPGVSL